VYEKYAWLVFFIIFLIIYGEAGVAAYNGTPDTVPAPLEGVDLSATVLTLLAIFYGSSASWCSMASDYYVHYPADVSRIKVFLMTTLGISMPTSFGMIAGACVSSAFTLRADWAAAEAQGLGFLVKTILYPQGFADFILVVFVLSGINVNIISLYSSAISCQQFARPFARVPRFIWTTLCFAVILVLALAGRDQLLSYLQSFLSLLGYWCTSYFIIVFSEHFVFRKGNFANYDLEAWNDPSRLPHGIAAGTAFGLGVIAWVMGMVSQAKSTC
jgi:purine-cytosine permease-like protein